MRRVRAWVVATVSSTVAPLCLASGGPGVVAYVSALTEDSVLRMRDLDGDGDCNDAGESTLFFGPGNAGGFPGCGSVQAILALGLDDVLAADGEEAGAFFTAVYRLRDLNHDRDAMDAGESVIWWDSTLPLPGSPNFDRPKAMLRLADSSVLLADNNTINFDNDAPEAVWRLFDLNGDGDVDDAGEVTLHVELSPVGNPFGFVCEDFVLGDLGRIYFTNLDSSQNMVNLWAIEPGAAPTLTPIASTNDVLGILWKEQGLALSPFSLRPMVAATDTSGASGLIEVIDLTGDGDADDPGELVARYDSGSSATGLAWDFNDVIDLETAPDGSVWLIELDRDRILRFADLDGNGNYQGAGEATVVLDPAAALGVSTDFPRRVAFALAPGPCSEADLAEPYTQLDFSDVVAFLVAFGAMDAASDLAPPFGQWDFSDVVTFLTVFGDGCAAP